MVRYKIGALSRPVFRWFYLGRAISLFGSAMTPVALAFAVLQVRSGQHLLGFILAAEILPNILLVLIGGSLSDRYRRDRLLLFSNLGSGLSQSGIAAIVLSGASPYWLLPLAVANGVWGAVTSPAMRGILPEIVECEDIAHANALLNTARSAARIVGPPIAGILVATLGGGVGIAIDAATFFIAAICLHQVHIPSHPAVGDSSIFRELREGWSYFRQRRWIWSITVAFTLMNAVQMGVWQVLGPILAKVTFGSSGWGVTLGVKAVGLLIASLAMLKIQLRHPLRDGMIAIAISGIPMFVLGQGYPLPYLMIAAALAGAGSTISAMGWDTSLQQAVPKSILSRVCAFDEFGSYMLIPLGELFAVPLADAFGYHIVATVGGIVFVIIALLPLTDRLVRRMTPGDLWKLKQEGNAEVRGSL